MKLFSTYLNSISDIIDKSKVETFSVNSNSNYTLQHFEKSMLNDGLEVQRGNKNNKVLIEFDNNQLSNLFGANQFSFTEPSIGSHPDFKDLKHNEFKSHYCVSMFMDIKGSTNLNGKYTLLQIREIKDTVLTLAIHVASHFGGHVNRLQGDGAFLQFARKEQSEHDAVINALNTASIITHFISSDLANVFESNQVKPLRVRIGIDLGFKEDVIWSHYGIQGCSELTTTSLHTDLAAKLQSKAKSNGILIGENIREILDIKEEFCQTCLDKEKKKDYYIYQGSINYRKYDFNWIKYLRSFDFISKASNSDTLEITEKKIRLKCRIRDSENDEFKSYYQNSKAIKKGSTIEYSIEENNRPYHKKEWETIEWTAKNSGKEAKEANELEHNFEGNYKNKTICKTRAGYVGHHYVECVIKRKYLDNIKLRFPIFVK